jgi:predicted nuclease of predicted toxin-antitoxin system
LTSFGYPAILLRSAIARGSPDPMVCKAAEANEAVLVAFDADMKKLAQGHGITKSRFSTLSLLKFACAETRAAGRLMKAMSLIEHEWRAGLKFGLTRRLFMEIGDGPRQMAFCRAIGLAGPDDGFAPLRAKPSRGESSPARFSRLIRIAW